MKIKIRPATRPDLEAIAALHIESFRDAYSHIFPAEFLEEQLPENLRRHWRTIEMRREDLVLIAEEDALIGFVCCGLVPARSVHR